MNDGDTFILLTCWITIGLDFFPFAHTGQTTFVMCLAITHAYKTALANLVHLSLE